VISNCIKEKDFPVIFDISDNGLLEIKNSRWFHYWKDKSEKSKLKKSIKTSIENIISKILPTTIEYNISDSIYFTSDYLKELYKNNGFKVDDSPVFHPFVPKVFFLRKRRETINYTPFKIIYLGRITAAKGVITIIEAMKVLKDQRLLVELSIIGNSDLEPEYYYRILSLINRYRLKNQITFKKQVSRKFVPELITNHHVTICPSIYPEAFMTIPLESMASNVPVIATPVGGNKEYLKHEENVLLFHPGNANELAKCITRLINDKKLYTNLQKSGTNCVSNNYTSNQIITKIEKYLIDTKINFNNRC
jgi:glycosyltransferase involved in cell wall biosynthesis